ncbi:type II secretion system F family protein [Nocardioides sp. Kera G14]|uniref:type II secretion system F family protein n=1 Tax=Nocardioides sp. Kera G14 TaxID=2884264 RepID=UPI001D101AC0|nr:type II secretion system F family protein [Nocardioides sp. Kera G14]UDY25390.1 type II secretion system F family protein [Nocardioides sp. Kera G14]
MQNLPEWVMYVAVAAVFVGLFGLIAALMPRGQRAASPADRLTTYTHTTSRVTAVKEKSKGGETSEVAAAAKDAAADLLKRNQGLEQRIAARLEGAGSELKPAEWLLLHTGIALIATLVGLALGGGNLIIGFLFLVLGIVVPWVYLGFKQNARRKAFNRALPDTLQLISGALSAGLSLQQSLDTVTNDGIEPVASEFRRILVETRLGVSVEDAMEGVAQRYESKDFSWVVMAIRIQRQVGGNLAELLDTVAATMREREYLRRQVNALAAEGKLSAVVLGLLPPLFVLYLCFTNWDYVSPLFTDLRGNIMLVGGTLWLGVGVFWMSRLIKVEV